MSQDLSMSKHELEVAYRNTAYCVDHSAGNFSIRLGKACARLDELLLGHGVTSWAFVTAWNPCSRHLPDEVNVTRHADLLAYVRKLKYPVFPGRGKPDSGEWIPEESLLILGIEEDTALRPGVMFDQNAVVIGRVGRPAEIRWCELPQVRKEAD